MDEFKGLLDKLPAPARHAIITFAGTWGGYVLNKVIDAKGVSEVPWSNTLLQATDSAAYATAVIMVTLFVTPLTKQYGFKKKIVEPVQDMEG